MEFLAGFQAEVISQEAGLQFRARREAGTGGTRCGPCVTPDPVSPGLQDEAGWVKTAGGRPGERGVLGVKGGGSVFLRDRCASARCREQHSTRTEN